MIYKLSTFRGYVVTTDVVEAAEIIGQLLDDLKCDVVSGRIHPEDLWIREDLYAGKDRSGALIGHVNSTIYRY